jgi:hypothetical protein
MTVSFTAVCITRIFGKAARILNLCTNASQMVVTVSLELLSLQKRPRYEAESARPAAGLAVQRREQRAVSATGVALKSV